VTLAIFTLSWCLAGSVLTVLPVMLLFVVLKKHYIAGIMLGGMKG